MQDGCCSSYKYEAFDEKNPNITFTVARHGTAADGDEAWLQLPCNYYEVKH